MRPTVLSVRLSVDQLIRPLAAQRGITLNDEGIRIFGGRRLVADRQRLRQILFNLLSNSVKYNREGGSVHITCEETADSRLRIKVSDSGAGIRPEQIPLLFQPFERLGAEESSTARTTGRRRRRRHSRLCRG